MTPSHTGGLKQCSILLLQMVIPMESYWQQSQSHFRLYGRAEVEKSYVVGYGNFAIRY